ncbi:acyloxyacyl hydrolase [Kordia sp. YSTF-M3]|uniref:Acyloxyacyl hydrolase n=1 Tax=Kordia aestuariivivens TaxID=2759037 RepID=A0ABR7Q410_9FLAO|nr:acyloxyacyl hydrolase [Kordia aestuariivivens]MBC8753282.1 acyloxyacyl hydrolase [Kordia aestuariivivens]
MKKIVFLLFFCVTIAFAQEKSQKAASIEVNYFGGSIVRHNNDILHLITGHPEGFIISYNEKTFGYDDWSEFYNYPDYGVSFSYQNLKNEYLGENVAVYGHYNFYFLKRNLMFRIGQGLAYTSNPYDKKDNFRNIAFGSRFMSSTYLMLNYKKENLFDRFGVQAGLSFVHYSNANVKAPNTSINTLAVNVGVNYNLDDTSLIEFTKNDSIQKFSEPIKFNFVLRAGINESDAIGSGQYGFTILSAYADKRLGRRSAIQLGTEVFFSNFLDEWIRYRSIAFPNGAVKGDEDFKRVGIFVGHELFISRFSIITQLGYYAYYPVDFEGRTYIRAGMKRYFGKKWYAVMTLKSHGAKAEATEFGVGIRL